MVWHYHDDDIMGDEAALSFTFAGLPQQSGRAKLQPTLTRGSGGRVFLAGDYLGTLYTESAITTGLCVRRSKRMSECGAWSYSLSGRSISW